MPVSTTPRTAQARRRLVPACTSSRSNGRPPSRRATAGPSKPFAGSITTGTTCCGWMRGGPDKAEGRKARISCDGMRVVVGLCLLACVGLQAQDVAPHLPPLDRSLPPKAERTYAAIQARVDEHVAMELATKIAPLWRVAGNSDFDRSLDWIQEQLQAGGIQTRTDVIPSTSQGWEMRDAVLRLDGPGGEIVLSRAQDRVPLA